MTTPIVFQITDAGLTAALIAQSGVRGTLRYRATPAARDCALIWPEFTSGNVLQSPPALPIGD